MEKSNLEKYFKKKVLTFPAYKALGWRLQGYKDLRIINYLSLVLN